jgi:hypothetical protein
VLNSDPGRTSGHLLDILISRQDWEGARTYLEQLYTADPAGAGPLLIEVLLAQAGATKAEEAQLELYQRIRSIDPGHADAGVGIERIASARRERARAGRELPGADEARPAAAPPPPGQEPLEARKKTREAPPPEIELRTPSADAALRKAREAEQKARTAVEAQVAALTAERERLLAEARAASAERDRLGALLEVATEERERLSVDLEIARTSYVGPDPSIPKGRTIWEDSRRARARRRLRLVISGVALAGAAALAAAYASRPAVLEVDAAPITLLDPTETAQVSATRILRLGLRRPAGAVAWSSTDPRVAAVDARGVITPVGTGRARIEATEGALVSSVEVTVSLPARIVVTPSELVLTPDNAETAVEASVLDGSGAPWKKNAELTWTSSEPGVATFAGGKVRRHGRGEAVIAASLGALSGRLAVRSLDRRSALEQACDAGGLDACVDLGHLIEKGDEGPADFALALRLHEKACKAGAMKGCVAAGESHENGRGGTPDVGQALAAYQRACGGKWAPGCTRLGRLYEATVRDFGKALPSYRAACDALDLEGCWRLGTMHELGSGVARDTVTAAELHRKACDGGKPQACTSLAHMRWNGSGAVARDVPGAIALFEQACEGRDEDACLFLALKYKAGEGVVEDPRKATVFFGKACAAGHKGSCVIAPRALGP